MRRFLSSRIIKSTIFIILPAVGFVITKAFILSKPARESGLTYDIISPPVNNPTSNTSISTNHIPYLAPEPQNKIVSELHDHSDPPPPPPLLSEKIISTRNHTPSASLPPHLLLADEINYSPHYDEVDPMSQDYLDELIESLRLAGMREDDIESLVQAMESPSFDTDPAERSIDNPVISPEYQVYEFIAAMRQSGMPESQINNLVDDILAVGAENSDLSGSWPVSESRSTP